MGLPENEVAADNQRRRMDEVSKSPVDGVIGNVISVARPALAVGSAVVASGATATGLVVAGGIVGGLGIVDWFRRLGNSKVNENLESLGQATEEALGRVEDTLRKHGTSIDEIKARIESEEFKDGMASASLQALRTTQKDRLNRMALILANGVKENDLNSESLDDMMRAAVELTEHDIVVLKALYKWQNEFLFTKPQRDPQSNVHNGWDNFTQKYGINNNESSCSFARLQALGFAVYSYQNRVILAPGKSNGGAYFLTIDGKKFYERLQEIAVTK